MTKQDKIDSIAKLFQEKIKPALLIAEVGDFEIRPSLEMTHVKLDKAITWMTTFISEEVTEYDKVYRLCKPETWRMYRLHGLTDLVEMKMLKIARKTMIDKWMKRPSTIRRTYAN